MLEFLTLFVAPFIVLNVVVGIVTYVTLLERKFAARMQSRIGPYRVGPHGLLQPIADAVKLMMKEDIVPDAADRPIYNLAPIVFLVPCMFIFATIPFAPGLGVADLNIGVLFFLAISSMEIVGLFMARAQGVGVISRELAEDVGISGPLLRGSGVAYDLRRADPYSSYEDFEFVVPVESSGDCFARYRVRMVEFRESLKIVRQALDGLPEGPVSSRPGLKSVAQTRIPKGETYARVEGARGEVGCYMIADGSAKPYRMKWRGASFSNLAVLPHIIPGHKVADVVAIMGSVDPVFGEVDR